MASAQPCKAGLIVIIRKLRFYKSPWVYFSSASILPGLYVYKGHTVALDLQFFRSAPSLTLGNLKQIGGEVYKLAPGFTSYTTLAQLLS